MAAESVETAMSEVPGRPQPMLGSIQLLQPHEAGPSLSLLFLPGAVHVSKIRICEQVLPSLSLFHPTQFQALWNKSCRVLLVMEIVKCGNDWKMSVAQAGLWLCE